MKSRVDQVKLALQAPARLDMIEALSPRQPDLTFPDINRLRRQLESFEEEWQPVKIAVVHTYTTELLRPYWTFEALLQGFALDLYEAPYGMTLQELRPGSGLLTHQPDVTFLLLQWEDLDPRLVQPLMALPCVEREKVAEACLEHLHRLLSEFRQALPGLLVVTLLPRFFGPELGDYDVMAPDSEANFRSVFKARLAARLRDSLPAVYFNDLDTLTEEIGRLHMFDFRLWQISRFPFSVSGAQAVTRRLFCYPVLLKQSEIKCIALDADNTIWGGIVGEDGPDGIALGPDYPGSVYIAFQRRLLEFQQRGFLLALCSKNNPQDVMEILTDHPHQVLREEHFASLHVNWQPKPDNLRNIARDLNIGLESFVFVDDSPHECLAVRRQLPQVTVVKTPEQLAYLPFCLDTVPLLEIIRLTDEDRQRTVLYAQERQRRQLAATSQTLDDYLTSLQMVMTIGLDDSRHIARIAQLTQKTNQFNLTTRRYTEDEVQQFIRRPDWLVAQFSLTDIFGDSGLVGLAFFRGLTTKIAEVDTFLMSCRVIGRQAETAFLNKLLYILEGRNIASVQATYIPTAKNAMVKDFWPQHGFVATAPDTFQIDLTRWTPLESSLIDVHVHMPGHEPF